MSVGWRTKLIYQPHLFDDAYWPSINRRSYPKEMRPTILRNENIISAKRRGMPSVQIAKKYGVSSAMVNYLLNGV